MTDVPGWEPPTLEAGRWTAAHTAEAPPTDPPEPPDRPLDPSGPPDEPRRGPDRARVAGLAAILAIIVAGITFVATLSVLDSHDTKSDNTATAPGPTIPGGATQPVDPDAAALGDLNVQQSDVPAGVQVGLIDGGTDAVNEPTLDLCHGNYPSETSRTARRQVAAVNAAGLVLSTEAVLYRDADSTVRAFDDLRAVTAKCPNRPVDGETTKFNPRPDAHWKQTPGVDRLAYDMVTTDAQGQTSRTVAVYLRRGRALLGIYFPSAGKQATIAGKTAIPDIVDVFAARMAKLPERVVNGTAA